MSDLGGTPVNPIGFIKQAITEDLSATEALRQFRAAGGAINNEAWFQSYGAARQAFGTRADLAGLAQDSIVPGEMMNTWAAGTPGEFNSFVEVYFRVPGQHAYESRFFIHNTDHPPTVGEAEDAAEAFFSRPDVLGYMGEGATMQFAVTTSVARMTGRAA